MRHHDACEQDILLWAVRKAPIPSVGRWVTATLGLTLLLVINMEAIRVR